MHYNGDMPTLNMASVDIYVFHREAGRPAYLLLRDEGGGEPGPWRHLTGTTAEGETGVACARRVVEAAIGLPVIALWALELTHSRYDAASDTLCIAPIFLAEVAEGRISVPAGQEGRWVTHEQAGDLPLRRSQHEALTRAHEEIANALDRGKALRITL